MNDNCPQEEVIRVIKWIADYPELWEKIWNKENTLSANESIEIIEELEKHSLYSVIPILLLQNVYSREVSKAIGQFLIGNTIKVWEKEGIHNMCQTLKEHLRMLDTI